MWGLRKFNFEITSNLEHYGTSTVSDWKGGANQYELPLDTLRLTGISTTDGISQSNVPL